MKSDNSRDGTAGQSGDGGKSMARRVAQTIDEVSQPSEERNSPNQTPYYNYAQNWDQEQIQETAMASWTESSLRSGHLTWRK